MQSRKYSLIEAVANTLIGYVIAIITQVLVFPMFDIHIDLATDLKIGLIFLVVSVVRTYVLRRLFNKLKGK